VVNGVRPDIPLTTVFRGIMPFFLADVVTVGLFLAFPEIILWVPRMMMGG
jgi:TRAP-type C4-dicarboxylate transport system permease large subunit